MLKIKKDLKDSMFRNKFKFKIILLVVSILFFGNNVCYPHPNLLRIPSSFQSTTSKEKTENAEKIVTALANSQEPITMKQIQELQAAILKVPEVHWIAVRDENFDIMADFVRWINAKGVDRGRLDLFPCLSEFIKLFNREQVAWENPAEFASLVHFVFTAIHPAEEYDGGHHRTGWELMNIIRQREKLPSVKFQIEWYDEYDDSLCMSSPRQFLDFIRRIEGKKVAGSGKVIKLIKNTMNRIVNKLINQLRRFI